MADQALEKHYTSTSVTYNLYMFLTEFDRLVSENKDAADQALQKQDDIQALIDQARETTNNARTSLDGAEGEAREGLRLAQLAKDRAQEASGVCPFLNLFTSSIEHGFRVLLYYLPWR